MIFRSLQKRNSSQKNTNTDYSEYSYSGIRVPNERAFSILTTEIKKREERIFLGLFLLFLYLIRWNGKKNTKLYDVQVVE